MKICIISKYPPIEGGVSSGIYWLAKGLGELEHEIFVVSNCWEVEDEYREVIEEDELSNLKPKNVHLFSTNIDKKIRFIPYFNPYDAKLSSLSIDVIKKHNPDIIFSDYLLPYGVSGLIVKQATKKPLIVKHAGSDITRLFSSEFLRTLFIEIFRNADIIITNKKNGDMLSNFGIEYNKFCSLLKVINPKEFNPHIKPFDLSKYKNLGDLPIFTYFGKFERMKKIFSLIDAAANINEDFILLLITEGGKKTEIIEKILKDRNLEKKAIVLPFQPPWKIPSILTASTCIVCPESYETPFLPAGTHFPIKIKEAMLCGKCTIIGEGVYKKYKEINNQIQDGVNTIVVNPDNTNELAEKMINVIKNPDVAYKMGGAAEKIISVDFEKYIESFIDICNKIIV